MKLQTMSSFSGPLDCMRTTIKTQGFRGLYQGLTAPLIAAMFENAISFTVYTRVQARVQSDLSTPSIVGSVISGGASGLGTATLLTPVELVKCRLQVQERGSQVYTGPLDCLKKTLKTEGVRALYTGHSATLVREIPGGMAYFGAYETFCKLFTPVGKKKVTPNHTTPHRTASSLSHLIASHIQFISKSTSNSVIRALTHDRNHLSVAIVPYVCQSNTSAVHTISYACIWMPPPLYGAFG